MGTIRYIDTHCHLSNDEFIPDLEDVVSRAISLGVAIINSAITPDTWNRGLAISKEHEMIFASAGLDPMEYARVQDAIEWIRSNQSELVAIGEAGVDHYIIRDHSQRDSQSDAFLQMIELANELKMPIQIHSRSAGRHALEVLQEGDASAVHLHAFDGKASLVRAASHDLGYYFSVPTSVVRSPQKQKMVKAIEIEHLLLETDSPVLSADKGARNEPANLPIALDEVAKILRRDIEEVREIVLENTLRLYKRINAK